MFIVFYKHSYFQCYSSTKRGGGTPLAESSTTNGAAVMPEDATRLNQSNTVWVTYDEASKTYLVEGNGTLDRAMFRSLLNSTYTSGKNTEEYTIKISGEGNNHISLPQNSTYLFNFEKYVLINREQTYDSLSVIQPNNMMIDLPDNLDTSKVTNMNGMFYLVKNANPNVSNWDTSNVTDMANMFYEADKANPDVRSNWDVSKVTNMDGTFDGAISANPDVTNWDTSNVTVMHRMFRDTINAVPNVKKWNTDNVTDMEHIFDYSKFIQVIRDSSCPEKDKIIEGLESKDTPTIKEAIKTWYKTKCELDLEADQVLGNREYKKYADAFYYHDKEVIDNINEKTFFNVDFSQNLPTILDNALNKYKIDGTNMIGGINLGYNYKFNDDLSLGIFGEYKNRISHNIALGTMVKYKELETFIRYRLALYEVLLNHNVDLYSRYNKSFKVTPKFSVSPNVGIYATYSSGVKINDDAALKARVGANVEGGVNLKYSIDDRYNVYLEPSVSAGYNNQKLYEIKDENLSKYIQRAYFEYNVKTGLDYTFDNNVILKGNVFLKGDMYNNLKVGTTLGLGYSY